MVQTHRLSVIGTNALPFFFFLLCFQSNAFVPSQKFRTTLPTLTTPFASLSSSITKRNVHPTIVGGKLSMVATDTTEGRTIMDAAVVARVAFVAGDTSSGYGKTSPEPNPAWSTVASQLARRMSNFGGVNEEDGSDKISAVSFPVDTLKLNDLVGFDIVIALGVNSSEDEARLVGALETASSNSGQKPLKAFLADPTCGEKIQMKRFAGNFHVSSTMESVVAGLIPWSSIASESRLIEKTETLLKRKSTEDYIFAVLFVIHALVTDIDVVKSDINPSWEKGVVQNVLEFKKMCDCCGPQISSALSDPKTKSAIDLLNAVDLRDQVGSYRVIVSNETPQLEDFTLCILQQNDCFNCDAPILDRPRVPLLEKWRGKPLDDEASRQILIGHLDHPAASDASCKKPWSWKIVVGANPAYDAFPMQHQIFYPSGRGKESKSLWYDPVFCVETLDGDLVWCKRHYRCTPRRHWSEDENNNEEATSKTKTTPGAWTLTTLDNGMVSEEKWTIIDAMDDLSWCVLHYSGAARRAGQSYVGALLCTSDGQWPESCRSGEGLERIRKAFEKCDLELWELFGGSTEQSYMWSKKFTNWAEENPPPLDRIGDISITSWRKKERERALKEQES